MPFEAKMLTKMAEIIKQLSSLLREKRFTEAASLVRESNVSFHDFYVAIRKNTRVFSEPTFWSSNLPTFFLSEILNSPVKVTFYERYLSKDIYSNNELNQSLIRNNFDEFKRFFKLTRGYRKQKFMTSLDELSRKPGFLQLPLFVQELEAVLQAEAQVNEEENRDNEILKKIPFDKILLGIVGIHEFIMQSEGITNNSDFQTMYDAAIVREAERIINLFLSCDKKNILFEFDETKALHEEWIKIKPNHKFEKPKEIILPSEYRTINEIINRGIERQSQRFYLDNYLAGFADMANPFSAKSIKLNQEHARYRFNDFKSRFEEMYFSEIPSMENLNSETLQKAKASFGGVYKFYNIPEKVLNKDEMEFDILKAHKLLAAFSEFKSPLGRTYATDGVDTFSIPKNLPDERFKSHFGTNEHISVFDEDELAKKISSYFSWSETESKNLLSILTIDILADSERQIFLQRPFIKSGKRILWLGRLLKNRRWDVILRNKQKQEAKDNFKGKVSLGLEETVRNLFRAAGFHVLPEKPGERVEFKLQSGEKGEIDLLSYRDGELVIAEVKSGPILEDPDAIGLIETVRLEGCAAEQLEKIRNFIEETWDGSLKDRFRSGHDFKDLKIFSLIITDFFEGDLKLFKGEFPKASAVEIEVILNNRKEKLLKWSSVFFSIMNSYNPEYKAVKLKENMDLWGGKPEFSLQILQDCIKNNLVWKELEDMKVF
jgi:hypothetical protein